ncbi:MAG TPA: SHOCT domain-containing protein, partial [Candidatus Limnocylindrales bacterium]|nr:SHOCT domain-containing protein [Candidatus Limnocylindrales bacterium]
WHMGFDGGFGIAAIVWLVVMVAFWALVIVGLVYLVRWLIRADRNSRLPGGSGGLAGSGGPTGIPSSEPLEILRQRYARGEIDEEEYERRRKTLTAG